MAYIRNDFVVKFVKTHPNAQLPKCAHEQGDAGFDLHAVEDQVLEPGTVSMVRTGLQLAWCPFMDNEGNQYYLDIRSRSGLSRKLVFPVTGTVDRNYRGEINVVLANMGKEPYHIKQGERVAQLVIQLIIANGPCTRVTFEETNEVIPTDRGSGGFGSTGR
jgi:dUTP pyrophosphatase